MDFSSETLYQLVRVLFAFSLLGFLYLVIRVTMRELQEPLIVSHGASEPQLHAQIMTMPSEDGSPVPVGMIFDIQGVATLGRASTARITLDDPSVSAQHALLRPVDGKWTIEDLGSRNGTLVNGRPITGQVGLNCGDSLQLGRVRLRLMC